MINKNDVLVYSQIATALGTLALAAVTYFTSNQNKEQLNLLKEQNRRLRHDKPALIRLNNWRVSKNHIFVDLENIGERPIFQIGLESRFSLANPRYSKEGNKNFLSFDFNPSRLVDNFKGLNKEIIDNGYVNWNINKTKTILRPKEHISLEFNPQFNFFYYKQGQLMFGKTNSRHLSFEELIQLIKTNGYRFFGLELSIIFKDYLESPQEPKDFFNFIFDVEKDRTLEDCTRKGHKISYSSLSQDELETVLDGLDSRLYRAIKNPRKG